eukprot:TRINITY_DN10872_c3_g1_i1.p1 TRINITY_DN10872_c3_g1~~TRINITY_DN10872_c3_g1_i1.p1  ORF type:complete len:1030 (-),score=181.65 TRINITY_DN10872_c3_g1_i1:146-3235(-)
MAALAKIKAAQEARKRALEERGLSPTSDTSPFPTSKCGSKSEPSKTSLPGGVARGEHEVRILTHQSNTSSNGLQPVEDPELDPFRRWALEEDAFIRETLEGCKQLSVHELRRPWALDHPGFGQPLVWKPVLEKIKPKLFWHAEDLRSVQTKNRAKFVSNDYKISGSIQIPLRRGTRGVDFQYRLLQAKAGEEEEPRSPCSTTHDADSRSASKTKKSKKKKNSSAVKAEEILRQIPFFMDIEVKSVGFIEKLAKVVTFNFQSSGQVMFRQLDPPGSCWILNKGAVGVYIKKKGKDGNVSAGTPRKNKKEIQNLPTITELRPEMPADDPNDPYGSKSMPSKGESVDSEKEEKEAMKAAAREARANRDLGRAKSKSEHDPTPSPLKEQEPTPTSRMAMLGLSMPGEEEETPRYEEGTVFDQNGVPVYATVEGFSAFNLESDLGDCVVKLDKSGTIFGELALQNDATRAATIKCEVPCEFLEVSSKNYRKVLRDFMDVGKAIAVMRDVPMFADLEASSPGILQGLAATSTFINEVSGQVIFRQGDPGQSCFIISRGQVGVFIRNLKKDPNYKAPLTPNKRSGLANLSLSDFRTSGKEKVLEAQRAEASKKGYDRPSAPTLRTTEGFSTFIPEESTFGDRVALLGTGALFGELALQNDAPRAATITCSQDSELLVLRKADYLEAVQSRLDKVQFFDCYFPGVKDLSPDEVKAHPANFFKIELIPAGQPLLFEGLASNPVFYFLADGVLQLRRHIQTGKNPAYTLSDRPMSAPDSDAAGGMRELHSFKDLRRGVQRFDTEGTGVVAELRKGACISAMSAVPLRGVEPFSVVPGKEGVTVYKATVDDLKRLPEKLMRRLRHLVAKTYSDALELAPVSKVEAAMGDWKVAFDEHNKESMAKKRALNAKLLPAKAPPAGLMGGSRQGSRQQGRISAESSPGGRRLEPGGLANSITSGVVKGAWASSSSPKLCAIETPTLQVPLREETKAASKTLPVTSASPKPPDQGDKTKTSRLLKNHLSMSMLALGQMHHNEATGK